MSRGRIDDTMEVIEKVAACNGKKLSDEVIEEFKVCL